MAWGCPQLATLASGTPHLDLQKECCTTRCDLDVFIYVKDVLDKLLAGCSDYHSLRPDVWRESHPEAVRMYRQDERRHRAEAKSIKRAKRRLGRK